MTFESVEYPDEDTVETSAAEQARTLLASSRNRTRFGRVFVEHLLAECNAAVERAHLAEAQVAEITAERTEWQRRANRGHVVAEVLRADLASANKRAETAERELAELREQHQPGPSLHAWRRPDGRCVHGEQDWIRESVRVYGGEHVSMETCSYQGEWKAADNAS